MRVVYKKKFNEWPAAMRKVLRNHTFRANGWMVESTRHNPVTYVMLDENKQLVGWALVAKPKKHPMEYGYFAMFYVKACYRRQGIGTQLANRIRKDYGDVNFGANDEVAEGFFDSVGWKNRQLI